MVVGDSAFGFSGMELETAVRYNLPLKIVIINNNGITRGVDEIEKDERNPKDIMPMTLSPWAKYEDIAIALGGKGRGVNEPDGLRGAMREMLADDNLWVINCAIDTTAPKKAQAFSWLTTSGDSVEKKEPEPKL